MDDVEDGPCFGGSAPGAKTPTMASLVNLRAARTFWEEWNNQT